MSSLPDKPAVLTSEVQQLIVQYVGEGNYFAPACIAAGTTRQTVEYWQKLYEAGAEHAQIYADFFAALAQARAIAEVVAVGRIARGVNGWQGAAWFVERRYPRRWNGKERAKAAQDSTEQKPATDGDGNTLEP